MLINNVQMCGIELMITVLSRCTEINNYSTSSDSVLLANRIITVQIEAGLNYVPQFSTVSLALSVILTKTELEYEQVPVVKLLSLLRKWNNKNGNVFFSVSAYTFTDENTSLI